MAQEAVRKNASGRVVAYASDSECKLLAADEAVARIFVELVILGSTNDGRREWTSIERAAVRRAEADRPWEQLDFSDMEELLDNVGRWVSTCKIRAAAEAKELCQRGGDA